MEFGTITPNPQSGNSKPRIFRLSKDNAIINRLGFPNKGIDSAIKNLRNNNNTIPIGLNIGCNKNSNDFMNDYLTSTRRLAPFAEWITVNISSYCSSSKTNTSNSSGTSKAQLWAGGGNPGAGGSVQLTGTCDNGSNRGYSTSKTNGAYGAAGGVGNSIVTGSDAISVVEGNGDIAGGNGGNLGN